MKIVFCGKEYREDDLLEQEKWFRYLYFTRENIVNMERVHSLEELSKVNYVFRYVERTLEILSQDREQMAETSYQIVKTVLQWAEVAKCGMPEQRERWRQKGFNLEIHNEASADIFMDEVEMDPQNETYKQFIAELIRTHGLLGQYIRGEVGFCVHQSLVEYVARGVIQQDALKEILMALNHAVIGAVKLELWDELKADIKRLVETICDGNLAKEQKSSFERLQKLFPAFRYVDNISKEEIELYDAIFEQVDLWYAQSALSTFSRKEINTIFAYARKHLDQVEHITFFPLAKTLTYDYEGKRKINVYKKRIVELCLREYAEGIEDMKSREHVSLQTQIEGDSLLFDVKFTKVCDRLIDFCVEAERSGIMTYEKSIQTIFDLFGFRRDIFDRLNNEDKYLETMNAAEESTKLGILDFVVGKRVVDVGSGGGVLLDVLEKKYPQKEIIGTDISTNVIEKLEQKIDIEGHHYQVKRHNFVEGPLEDKVDTILFSSIIHEIYSYTEWNGERFQIDAVKAALKNAYESLNKGGRIVIRDGIMTEKNAIGKVRFKNGSGKVFCENYLKDFEGLKELQSSSSETKWNEKLVLFDGEILTADLNFIREALYTYTWGTESYAQEVMEQFGYFTLQDFGNCLRELGMQIVHESAFTEPGYPDNLNPLVDLLDGLTWEDLPSNCIIAAQK